MGTRHFFLGITFWLIGFSVQSELAFKDYNAVIPDDDWDTDEETTPFLLDYTKQEPEAAENQTAVTPEDTDNGTTPFLQDDQEDEEKREAGAAEDDNVVIPDDDWDTEGETTPAQDDWTGGENVTVTTINDANVKTTAKPTKPPERKKGDLQCPPLPLSRLEHGSIKVLRGQRIRFSCDKGYRLIGPSLIRCYKGRWSNSVKPRCILPHKSCERPEPIPHGKILGGDRWTDGSTIMYICNPGYVLLGKRGRTCEEGHWSSASPACQAESEPLIDMAARLKEEFIDEAGSFSSDSRGGAIGKDVEHTGLELILLIDQSSSIDPVDFKHGIEFAKFLVDEFGAQNGVNKSSTGTRLGVITFADDAKFAVRLDDASVRSKQDAKVRLDAIKPGGGGTAIQRALIEVILSENTWREKAKKAVFLLTDGQNNVGNDPPSIVADDIKKKGAEIFAVGIGRDVNRSELVSIASEPAKSHVFLLNAFSDLVDIMSLIRNGPTAAAAAGPEKCGFLPKVKGKDFREAVPGWPWLAAIYVKHPRKDDSETYTMGICSGGLICSQWVLTSAGCFYGENNPSKASKFKNAFVTLGEDDLTRNETKQTNFRVSKVVLHPKFRLKKGSDNDLALVQLAESAPLELTYRPICLPTAEHLFKLQFDKDHSGTMAGWGAVPSDAFYRDNYASAFKILPEVSTMPFANDLTCKKLIRRNAKKTFCAGSVIRRTCSGNLGSPIIVRHDSSNIHFLIGVLSNKTYCNTDYNVFTDVTQHLDWIQKVTNSCQDRH